MAVEFESPESGKVSGVSMEFPVKSWSSSPPRMPRRLRRRLSETKATSPSTVEEIEAKLRDADLRRQKFYESLSSRARPKPRSPSQSSSHEDDLGQRLEAKLQAAEQKRLSMLAQAQMRLAKLDELRQAAKSGVEMRFKKEKADLGTKVDLRVQQAEANRMLILKAHRQRRASLKERTSQSLLYRTARETKYKERVRAAIHQKRLAAEKKRLGLLEAEKKKAHARMLQVREIAKYVSYQREIERKKMKDKLEDRLQRAKRQRAEYLSQKGRQRVNLNKMQEQADLLSRKLARCWRRFLRQNKPTLALAKAYDALNINLRHAKSMPFEQLALLIESPTNLQTVKALLDRFEYRYKLLKPVASTINNSRWDDIDHLLKRVASPIKRASLMKSNRSRAPNRRKSTREATWSPVSLSRYQARVVLCAYMILGHPDAVLSGNGEREIALAKSAEKFIQEFELLIKIVLDGPRRSSIEKSDPVSGKCRTFRSQLADFDAAWCSYLNSFVMWKVKDAESLEEDLVRAACQLELSMLQTCKMTPNGDSGTLTHDMKAIQKQVTEDKKLLREKVHHLSGEAGIERMESALSNTRMRFFQAKENGSPVGSPVMHIVTPNQPSSPLHPSVGDSNGKGNTIEGNQQPNPVVRSLFRQDFSSSSKEIGLSAPCSSSRQIQNSGEKLVLENELIVNEFLHEHHHTFAGNINEISEEHGIKSRVKEMMEKAFWDGILDSMKQNEPKYDQVVELMREVRDEISEMAPRSWRGEISESIDLDIISQLLNSGKLDMDYFGKILEFALITLQKLSAPANEEELKVVHQNLLKELAEICQAGDGSLHACGIALIKGLRFVLEQIQALKQEISKARIKIVEPLLRGPAGLDYLKNAFSNRYGSPDDASTALPLTFMWLSSVWDNKDQEWLEHTIALSELASGHGSSSQRIFPSTLRAGGSTSAQIIGFNKNATEVTECDDKYPECKGEKVDLVVRLGLLKLVSGISGLTQEALPETLKLNFARLRGVQAELQKIIVICTSVLVLRQTLLGEQMVQNSADMENILTSCSKQLSEKLNSVEDAGIKEITEILGKFAEGEESSDTARIQSRKNVMASMLTKSLQAGDPVFVRVSRAVYLAVRGVVLGGSGPHGRELAEVALRQVGAAVLLDKVVGAAKVVLVASTVSCGVHDPWYAHLVQRM